MRKIESKIINYINRNIINIFVFVVCVISIIVRFYFIDSLSYDMSYYNLKWFDAIKSGGGILALKNPIAKCDYTQTYLFLYALLSYIPNVNPIYAIKLTSIIFDFILAIYSAKIVSLLLVNNKNRTLISSICFSAIILSPTVILNSAWWGQSDSIYTCFVIISIYYLLKEKYINSFVFLGIAFSFKLQTIFILPLYIIMYFVNKKYSILYFLIIPLTMIFMNLPSIIMGYPILDCFSIYWTQINEYSYEVVFNILNAYTLFPYFEGISYIFFAFLLLILGCLLVYSVHINKIIENERIISLSLLSVILCVFLLPCMHERYLYMADILSIIWCSINSKKIFIPLLVNFVSLTSYFRSITVDIFVLPNYIGAFMFLFVLIYMLRDYIYTNNK